MAGNDGCGTAWNGRSTSRRAFVGGVGTLAAGVPTASADGAETVVDLGSHGLRRGDLLDPYLEEHFTDGTELHIPAGAYDYTGTGLGGDYANASLVGSAEGVTLTDTGTDRRPTITATDGTVRFENITVRGAVRSGWDVGAQAGATVVLSSVSCPDRTDTEPASLPKRIEIDGTGGRGEASYELAVTGNLTLDEGHTVVGDGEPLYLAGDIGAGTVGGRVRNGVDAFFYGGLLERVELDGDAEITVFQG